jgi:haloalkane dehalogenase
MAYVEIGGGRHDAVFIHGNPTSSYLWRNVIPHVTERARCIVPDLIGMGDSEKLPGAEYRFVDHSAYLDAFLDAVTPEGQIVLIVHDWGSALGFDWARRHESRIAGLAFMEFIPPMPTWNDFPDAGRNLFRAFREPETGRRLLIDENYFIEKVLPRGVVRPLSEAVMNRYRTPFLEPATREPLYRFPNELPIDGLPADVFEIAEQYHSWLLETSLPKLFFWARPGGLIPEQKAAWYASTLHNTRVVAIGSGKHFLQEDNPHLIGAEIAAWLSMLP